MLCICSVFSCSGVLNAQQQTADVVGTVTDATGAIIPGATVTITNLGTNISNTTMSTASGDYAFNLLPPGAYSVKVESSGFKSFAAQNITLAAGDRARVDAKLEVGSVSQTVEVQATVAPALQTDTSNVETLVTSQAVEDVPLNGRNPTKLIQLSAGVSIGAQNDLTSGNRPDDRRPSSEYTVNGQAAQGNNNMLDGMDNNERFIGAIGVKPSVDAIQEVVVNTNLYDASIGRTAGGIVNVITKSGTNQFHGSAYEFFRNRDLNTNPNYAFPSGYCGSSGISGGVACTPGQELLSPALGKPAFRQNQYGASLGGPIKKDKSFFFGDFERFVQALGQPMSANVPTLCQRGSLMAAAQGYKGPAITCPDGTSPVDPGNMSEVQPISSLGGSANPPAYTPGVAPNIPFASESPIGLAFFSLYPLPNATGLTNNYNSNPARTQTGTTLDGRFDQHFSDKNTLYTRYSYNDYNTLTPTNFPVVDVKTVDPFWTGGDVRVNPGGQFNAYPGPAKQRQQSVLLSYVHVFRPDLLLNLKAGYLRSATNSLNPNPGGTQANQLGIGCTSQDCINFGQQFAAGIPILNFGGVTQGSGGGTGSTGINVGATIGPGEGGPTPLGDPQYVPLHTFDNTYSYYGLVTWDKGSHSIKMGVGVIRRQLTSYQSMEGQGIYNFAGIYTGTGIGDLLEGLSATAYRSIYIISPGYRAWEPSAYVQDDWRARHWLTVNLGVRYDIFTPYTEKRGRISNWDPYNGLFVGPSIPGAQNSGPTALIPTNYNDVAPRIGFAATLSHQTVIRGGFGLVYLNGSGSTLRNTPFNFTYACGVVAENGSSGLAANGATGPACPAPLANNVTAKYGALPSSSTSSVGQIGGNLLSVGLPTPVLNVNLVFPPANCTFVSNATYATTCPNNPYTTGGGQDFSPIYKDPYLEQTNLNIQKAFGGNVVSVGYVGQFGHRISETFAANGIVNNLQNGIRPLVVQYPWLGSGSYSEGGMPWGTSSYSSLQATFVRRFQGGLTVQANYTWSHALAFGGNAACVPNESLSLLGITNGPKYTNPCFYDNPKNQASPITVTNLLGGYYGVGNSVNDVPNRVSGTLTYELPFAKGKTGVEGQLLKGWSIAGAGTWQSGFPFSVGLAGGLVSGVGGTRPDQLCGQNGPKSLQDWGINPNCFEKPASNTYGNELVNQFYGPSNKYMDGSLAKEFSITEQFRLQFRTEIFNLFNTPNFSQPSVINIPAFGSNNLALLQSSPTALKVGAITSLNNNYNSRQIQFALKLLF
jgi:Carboxypeptidase regulatory-like domain